MTMVNSSLESSSESKTLQVSRRIASYVSKGFTLEKSCSNVGVPISEYLTYPYFCRSVVNDALRKARKRLNDSYSQIVGLVNGGLTLQDALEDVGFTRAFYSAHIDEQKKKELKNLLYEKKNGHRKAKEALGDAEARVKLLEEVVLVTGQLISEVREQMCISKDTYLRYGTKGFDKIAKQSRDKKRLEAFESKIPVFLGLLEQGETIAYSLARLRMPNSEYYRFASPELKAQAKETMRNAKRSK